MPESPMDDPFADLFGKLPDARDRRLRSAGDESERGAAPVGGAAASGDVPRTSADAGSVAPLSRREAREAAAREARERVEGAPPTARPETAVTQPDPPRPAASSPSNPADTGLDASISRSGVPATRAVGADVGDDAWLFAAGPAPAVPYSRTGAAPQVEASATSPERGSRTATIEDLFTGTSSTDDLGAVPPPPDKRRRRVGGWIALGIVLLVLGGIAAGVTYVWVTYEDQIRELMGWEEPKDFEEGMANGEVYVTIVSGDTGAPISQSLYEAGVTKTPDAFYDYLIENGENPPFVPGVFKLQKQMTSAAALEALLDPANKMKNTAQLREGLTVEQSLPLLAEGTGLPVENFQAAVADPSAYGVSADSLEGWLFPATYTFDPDVTAEGVIQTLVDRTVQSLDAAEVPEDRRQEILTIASIIQREARFEADMQKVSRVIQNRLDPQNQETFGLLQMDSTAQYGYGEMHDGTASSSQEALEDDNPWNTYVNTGLPVGPISNPGDVAIDAAMHPAEGPWLYFVTVNLNTGETVFTTNLADHNQAVAQWQEWCSANPDAGC